MGYLAALQRADASSLPELKRGPFWTGVASLPEALWRIIVPVILWPLCWLQLLGWILVKVQWARHPLSVECSVVLLPVAFCCVADGVLQKSLCCILPLSSGLSCFEDLLLGLVISCSEKGYWS